ncbi:MAG: anthranilate phosphoribosyltransferase [Thaumarchaeota archaeon]|nr:anthranilate phosphoribosyltransferase [Nitrososphaerota archaeon]
MNIHEDIIHLAGAAGCEGKAARVMEYMLAGEGTDDTYAAILRAIASREQSDGELKTMLDTIRGFMVSVEWNGNPAIDVCGTGGDGLGTFNISTAAAFVAAASGATVAKHGNRSSSGSSGSAEIFQGLGVDIMACPVEQMLDICRICFMFAPRYHKAARHVAAARRTLGMRTVFNTLGPLCNPAGVRRQLVGVSDINMVGRMPRILAGCGAERVICVMSAEGADEFLPVSKNVVCSYVDGRYHTSTVRPEDVGARRATMPDILLDGRDPLVMFAGAVCGRADIGAVHTVAMNAGAGLYAAGLAENIRDGFRDALESIESGNAEKLLYQFTKRYGDAATLEDMI